MGISQSQVYMYHTQVIPLVAGVAPPLARAALQQAIQTHSSLLQQAVQALAAEVPDSAPRIGWLDLYTNVLAWRNQDTAAGHDTTDSCLQ